MLTRQFRVRQPLSRVLNARVQAGTRLGRALPTLPAARILIIRASLKTMLPQDTASASSLTCSRLDEAGTKMSSSQPTSANAAA